MRCRVGSTSGRVALAAGVLLLGACTQDEVSGPAEPAGTDADASAAVELLPEPVQELEIDATEYSFVITPDPSGGLRPGWTSVRFHNTGGEPHQVMFARLKDGVDMSELAAAGAGDSSGAGAIEFVDMIGGISYIGPGQETTAMVDLSEGLVMAMCYVPDEHGVAHALMGMSTSLTVLPADGSTSTSSSPGTGEEVLGTIELSEDGYRMPEEMGAGWYHVVNTDDALHELSLLRLDGPIDDGRAEQVVEDLAANRTPEVALEAVGGMGAVSAGFDGYLYLDLADGDYLAVDFMPDPGDPRPHMLDGYFGEFSV